MAAAAARSILRPAGAASVRRRIGSAPGAAAAPISTLPGSNFWRDVLAQAREEERPITALAPMAAVTDVAYRAMVVAHGRPDAVFTEFVSAAGLCSPAGRAKLGIDLLYEEPQRHIVAQVFGSDPDTIERASALCAELGFSGVDVNMGCPDKSVTGRQASGAALITDPPRALAIVAAAKRGVAGSGIPVSVKTRAGYNTECVDTWIRTLLEAEPAALTLHGRTKKQMSKVPARWDVIGRAGRIVAESGADTVFLGNGDVTSIDEATRLCRAFGHPRHPIPVVHMHAGGSPPVSEQAAMGAYEPAADGSGERWSSDTPFPGDIHGVMIGRGVYGNPWVFGGRDTATLRMRERLVAMLAHVSAHHRLLGSTHKGRHFVVMRKNLRSYASGFNGSKELRMRVVNSDSAQDVLDIVVPFAEAQHRRYEDAVLAGMPLRSDADVFGADDLAAVLSAADELRDTLARDPVAWPPYAEEAAVRVGLAAA